MTIRKALIVGGIFLAGVIGGWMLAAGSGSDIREAAPLAASPRAEGQNGLTDADRTNFYHLSEGGELFPLDWLLALDVEVPANDGSVHVRPFLDNIERFGLLPDSRHQGNPYGLPVGISLARAKLNGDEMIGLNCRRAHVGQVQYPAPCGTYRWRREHGLREQVSRASRIGNRSHDEVSNAAGPLLGTRARGSSGAAEKTPPSRDEDDVSEDETFARRVAHLFTSNRGLLEAQVRALRNIPTLKRSLAISTEEGYGRLDAFGIGRDELFGAIGANSLPADGPVSIPHIWGLEYTGWLQWGANTNSVMERNIGQALGVGALFDAKTFDSTVRLENLHQLETLAYNIKPPKWPDTFPPIDTARAERGRGLFYQNCAGCHETFKTDGQVRNYQLFSLDEVGTDPMTAINYERQVLLSDGTILPFPAAALALVTKVKAKGYQERNLDDKTIALWSSGRSERVRSGIRRSARRSSIRTNGTIPGAARSIAPRRLSASGRQRRSCTMGRSRRCSICCGPPRTGR
jgi:hypothetical protein